MQDRHCLKKAARQFYDIYRVKHRINIRRLFVLIRNRHGPPLILQYRDMSGQSVNQSVLGVTYGCATNLIGFTGKSVKHASPMMTAPDLASLLNQRFDTYIRPIYRSSILARLSLIR